MIGKNLLDKFGVTKFLDGDISSKKIEFIPKIQKNSDWDKFQQEVKAADGDVVKIKAVIDNSKLKQLKNLDGLYDYAVNQSKTSKDVDLGSVNNLIQTQNYKNIADQAHGFKGVNAAIKEYNKLTGEASKSKFLDAIKNTNHSLADYLSSVSQADAGIIGYGKSLAIATAKTFALQAATTVLNAAVSMGISAAINIAVTAITQWIAKENELLDSASALGDELNSTISDIDSYKDKINELKGTISDSGSSIEEVTSARQELMSIQDELIEKYGKEAGGINLITEAINGETSALNELKRAKYEESKAEINEKGPGDYVDDFATTFENGHKELFNVLVGNPIDDGIEEEKSKFDEFVESMESRDITIPLTMDENIDNLIESAGFSKTEFGFSIHGSAYDVRDELQELKELTGKYDLSGTDFSDTLQEEINSVNALIAANDTLYKQYVLYEKVLDKSSGKNYDEHYNILTNAAKEYNDAKIHGNEEEIQSASEKYANALHEAMKVARENEDYDVEEYFRNLYPTIQKEISKWDFSSDIKNNNDGITDNIQNAISKLKGMSSEDIINFNAKVATDAEIEGYGMLEECAEKYNMDIKELINLLQELGYVQPEKYKELVEHFGEDNINKLSKDEIKIAYTFENLGDMTFEELQNKIAETRKKAQESQTFSKVWDSIGTTGSDEQKKAAKEEKEKLLELAKAGKLTPEVLENNETFAPLLETVGNSAEIAADKINKMVEASDQLSSMKSGIQSISEVLGQKKENLSDKKTAEVGIGADKLAGFDASIKGLDSWDEFEKTLGNGKKSMDDCRKVANKLATEWVNSNNFLSQLNDTDKDYYISTLKEMGVENAEAVVTAANTKRKQELEIAEKYLKAAKESNTVATTDLSEATAGEIDALAREQGWSEKTKAALYALALQKQTVNGINLSTSEDIDNLIALVQGLEGTTKALKTFKKMQKNGGAYSTVEMANAWRAAKKEVEDAKKRATNNVEVNVVPSVSSLDAGKKKKEKKEKKQKESKQEFDWMERKVTVLNNKLSETQKLYDAIATSMKKADSSSLVRKENANLNKQIRMLRKLRATYGKQEKNYQSKANKYAKANLSKDLQNKVKNGKIKGSYSKLVKQYGEKKANKIQKAIDLYEKASTARQNKVDTSTQIKDAKIQKHQNRADLAQSKIDKNAARAELVHLSKKNKYIDNEIKQTEKLYSHQIDIARLNRDNEEVARLQAERDKEIRDLEVEKLQNIADEGEESYTLYKTQASMTTNYKDRNKLAKNVTDSLRKQYSNLIKIAEKEGDIVEKNRLQLELQQKLNEESKERIQNVSEDYGNRLIENSRQIQVWNNAASLAEAKGKTVNADFYNQMASVAGQEEEKRKKEVDDVWQTYYEQMRDNPDFINSQEWYDSIQIINDATDAYEQAQISAEQYRQKAIEANWSIADTARQAIDYLNDEAEAYKNIFGYKDMYDKNGVLTDAGTATFALDVYGIKNNIDKIEKYNSEIDELNKQYKDDDISIEKYNERMQELKDGVMDSTEAIYSLRDAMKSLIEEGLNAEMDALNESIDKVKQNLSDASSLREYQKNIEKQTKSIASLERQINAKSGDMSEKGRSDLQKLKVQLEDARSELEDTEYDKYIEDQERILDDMSDDFQKYLDAQLDQVDRLLQGIIDSIGDGKVPVSEIIKQVGDTIGVDLSRVLSENLLMFANTGNTNAGGVYDNTVKDYKDSAKEEFDKGGNTPIMNTDEKKGTVESNAKASDPAYQKTSAWLRSKGFSDKDIDTMYGSMNNAQKVFSGIQNAGGNPDAMQIFGEYQKNKVKGEGFSLYSQTDIYKEAKRKEEEHQQTMKDRKNNNDVKQKEIARLFATVRKYEEAEEYATGTLFSYGAQKFAVDNGKGDKKFLSMDNVKKIDSLVKELVDVQTGKPVFDTSSGTKVYDAIKMLDEANAHAFSNAIKNRKVSSFNPAGFSKGGIVDTSTLAKVAKDNGDDAWVTVKSGEGILNPMDTQNILALTESLERFKHAGIQPLDSSNMVTNNVNASSNMYGDVSIHLDGSNVIDPKSFVKTVQNSREMRNVILNVVASETTNDTMAYMR